MSNTALKAIIIYAAIARASSHEAFDARATLTRHSRHALAASTAAAYCRGADSTISPLSCMSRQCRRYDDFASAYARSYYALVQPGHIMTGIFTPAEASAGMPPPRDEPTAQFASRRISRAPFRHRQRPHGLDFAEAPAFR